MADLAQKEFLKEAGPSPEIQARVAQASGLREVEFLPDCKLSMRKPGSRLVIDEPCARHWVDTGQAKYVDEAPAEIENRELPNAPRDRAMKSKKERA